MYFPPKGALSLDLDPLLLPSTVKIPQGGAWAQPVVPVTTSQISAILLIFLQSYQVGGYDGRLLRADRAGLLFLAEHSHHLPTPEN